MSDAMDAIERIAKEKLGITSFAKIDPRRRDEYVVPTFKLRDALWAAFAAGRQLGLDEGAEIESQRHRRRR